VGRATTLAATGALLLLLTSATGRAQTWPSDWRPFIRLGFEATRQRYQNPIVDGGRLVDPGVLVESGRVSADGVGSGSVITSDGLILTNFHVATLVLKPRQEVSENRQTLVRVTPLNTGVMLVYELDAKDPLKAPTLQYRARFLAGNEDLDVAILKIFARGDGTPLARKDFAAVALGNPYAIPVGDPLHIIGFPGKGGATVTPTITHFSGYMEGAEGIRDGVFKTLSTISGGNSGGAALYQTRHVGVPSAGTISGRGAEFGFIHPITWAIQPLALIALRDGQPVPAIDPRWVENEHNPDVTRNQIFLGGKVVSAFTARPVAGARVFFHRPDRSFEQIAALDREATLVLVATQIKRMLQGGLALADVAQRLGLNVEQVRQISQLKLSEDQWSADLKQLAKGEFFYRAARTDAEGFFMVAAPRKQKFRLVADAPQFRQIQEDRTSGDGLFANVGPIQMMQVPSGGPSPTGPPPGAGAAPGGSPFAPPGSWGR
jgi:hypothetical protein